MSDFICELTPGEILFLAERLGKTSVFGIMTEPDLTDGGDCAGCLMEKGYIDMGFTGEMSVSDRVSDVIDALSGCERYLTLNVRTERGYSGRVIWKHGEAYYPADRDGERYAFRPPAQAAELRGLLLTDGIDIPEASASESAVIPRMQLVRAKRLHESGDLEAAERLLAKSGASDGMAHDIALALFEKGQSYSAVLSDRKGNARAVSAIIPGAAALSYEPEVVDFRTCVRFSPLDAAGFERQLGELLTAFTAEGGAV